jgi:membrane associated rhomboid family serine protease
VAFSNQKLIQDLIFYPPAVTDQNQWYRFFTCGLIHADYGHLIFNMVSLYMFGDFVEQIFVMQIFGNKGKLIYLLLYVSALAVSMLPTYFKHRNDNYYRSLGASGAVSAIVFAGIFLEPLSKIGFFIIPPVIPGFIFAPLYLVISAYLAKKGGDNINHSAHIYGAIYGVAFLILACSIYGGFSPVENFIDQIKSYFHI